MQHLTKNSFIFLTILFVVANCGVVKETKNEAIVLDSIDKASNQDSKQLFFLGAEGKETNTPNFVRLVVMRLIYGLASSMGIEERLENAFNGVFVPPNADEGGIFNFGGLGGGGGEEEDVFGGIGDIFDI